MDVKRLVNAEGVTDHTALLPTKNKSQIAIKKITDNWVLTVIFLYFLKQYISCKWHLYMPRYS